MAQRAGQRVRAHMHDRPTEDAMVIPNCVKNVPDVPGINVTGMNTAIKTRVQLITATETSLMASLVALCALVYPDSNFAITASTTTMASSTTVPMARTRAKRVRMLRENPASLTTAKVPSSDTIMDIEGTSVALKF